MTKKRQWKWKEAGKNRSKTIKGESEAEIQKKFSEFWREKYGCEAPEFPTEKPKPKSKPVSSTFRIIK